MAYFDYAAATPLDPRVLSKMLPYLQERFYNPSALYGPAREVRNDLEHARQLVASLVGVKPAEVIFTSGCTEANNLAIKGVMSAYNQGRILFSAIEHDSVRAAASQYPHTIIPVGSDGTIDLEQLDKLITDDVVMVSCMLVNNETGVVQPYRQISEIVAKHRKLRSSSGLPLYLHCDAAQAAMYYSVDRSSMGADFISLNGSKIFGPKGSGCLVAPISASIRPLLDGGGQERGLRSGTENVAGAIGFAHALENAQRSRESNSKIVAGLKAELTEGLEAIGGILHAPLRASSPHILSIAFPGEDNERLIYKLDERGMYIARGSACHANSKNTSHVLDAMGVSSELQMSTVRLSLAPVSTHEQVEMLAAAVEEFLNKNTK